MIYHFAMMKQALMEMPGIYTLIYVENTSHPSIYMVGRDGRISKVNISLWGTIPVFRRWRTDDAMHDMEAMAINGSTFTQYHWGNL